MLRYAGVWLIEGYQRHLSPRKGFCCAYGKLHGKETCSSIGKNIMWQKGWFAFFRLMPLQFKACGYAAVILEQESKVRTRRSWRERMQHNNASNCADCAGVGECLTELACSEACSLAEMGACLEVGSCF